MRGLGLAFITIAPACACSCLPSYHEPPACAIFHKTPVIFRGKIIEQFGGHFNNALSRVQVVEAFKGLPPDVREVIVLGSIGAGYDWIFYLDKSQSTLDAYRKWLKSQSTTDLNPWPKLGKEHVYSLGFCCAHTTSIANEEDLKYLRARAQDKVPINGWVQGVVVQNWFPALNGAAAVFGAGVRVGVRNGSRHWESVTRGDGNFRIENLPEGEYDTWVSKAGFSGVTFAPKVSVPACGCGVLDATLETNSSISGMVLDARGRPAPDAEVEVAAVLPGGAVKWTGPWGRSDSHGRFSLAKLPVARIVVGSNIGGVPTRKLPYDPVHSPGTSTPANARMFYLRTEEHADNVILRLPPLYPFGELLVDVVWPDGKPAVGGARARVWWNGHEVDEEGAGWGTNRISLFVPLGKNYQITADWTYFENPATHYVAPGEPTSVLFAKSGQQATARLKEISPHRPR